MEKWKRTAIGIAAVGGLAIGLVAVAAAPERMRVPFSPIYKPAAFRGSHANLLTMSGTHGGVDVGLPVGTSIKSVADGRVYRIVYNHPVAGTYIEIEHLNPIADLKGNRFEKLYSRYLHLAEPTESRPGLQVGDYVGAGREVGKSGGMPGAYGAGNTTAPHLHFELWNGPPFTGGTRLHSEDFIEWACPSEVVKSGDYNICVRERNLKRLKIMAGGVVVLGASAAAYIYWPDLSRRALALRSDLTRMIRRRR
jgi:hypothetical protein